MLERTHRQYCLEGSAAKSEAKLKPLRVGKTQKSLAGGKWKYGVKSHKLYLTWSTMRNRCNNKNAKDYKYYGGRGIKVCHRWDYFNNFVNDMGRKPSPIHQLDRKDNSSGYSPDNCRWVTRLEQMNNTRSVKLIKHRGLEMTISEWGRLTGISGNIIGERLRQGWSIRNAIETPKQKPGTYKRKLSSKSQSLTL